jgi:putative redox protein
VAEPIEITLQGGSGAGGAGGGAGAGGRGPATRAALISRPPPSASAAGRRFGLILCDGFPMGPWGPASMPEPLASLGDRVANDTGWLVLTLVFSAAAGPKGGFSINGWLADIGAAVEYLMTAGPVEGVWLAGFSLAGAVALSAAGLDPRIRGVAAFAAPADLHEWLVDPRHTAEHLRSMGIDADAEPGRAGNGWVKEVRDLRPLDLIAQVPPRPVLLVHGADDEVVSLVEARALADAAAGHVDLRVLAGAGHGLRYDPRAVAILLGWLDRQAM